MGLLAGCWLAGDDGTVRVNQDGVVVDGLGSGGDGGRVNFNRDTLFPETDRQVVNFNVNYEFADNFAVSETKYVRGETTVFNEQDTFYDTLEIRADNAFIPDALQPVAAQTGYLLLTQDPLDLSDNNNQSTHARRLALRGSSGNLLTDTALKFLSTAACSSRPIKRTRSIWIVSIQRLIRFVMRAATWFVVQPSTHQRLPPDYFAGSNGFADGNYSSDRYYSFTPGDGQSTTEPIRYVLCERSGSELCNGRLESTLKIQQWVFNVTAVGQFEVLQSVLDGPVGYAAGVERREESSDNRLDPLTLGVIPEGSPYEAGQSVNSISPWLYSFIRLITPAVRHEG